jgi:predicted RNA-binding Zn ribbon-like protein
MARTPQEHLSGPSDLADWIVAVGLLARPPQVGAGLLRNAHDLRESIYRAARAVAAGERPSEDDRSHINEWAGRHDAVRVLGESGAYWQLPDTSPARSALAVLATDAVDTLGGVPDGTIKVCSGVGCIAVFLDTSRGRSRRWCSMGTCGNRAKKNAMRVRQAQR